MKLERALVCALLALGLSANSQATEYFDATIGGPLRSAYVNDWVEFLGSNGSTNPAYTYGYVVMDHLGDAPQSDGTFANEQYSDVEDQVSDDILMIARYGAGGYYTSSVNPFDPDEVHRSRIFSGEEKGYVSLNINVFGSDLSIHKELTTVTVSSVTHAVIPSRNKTTVELQYRVSDQDPDPNIYDYNRDPTYNFPVPSLTRQINANVTNWFNNPGTYEIIDGVSEGRDFALQSITIRVTLAGVALPDLAAVDLGDPTIAALVTNVFMQVYFEDAERFYPDDRGRVTVISDGALTTTINEDLDEDSLVDSQDNCPATPNFNQLNTDGGALDGGDACDTDDDNDGSFDIVDNCPLTPNADQADEDNDGLGNACDPDYVPCVGCGCPL